MEIDDKIWVFLSHSHEDFENVSLLRNLLEERGYRPIMFYLKCLDDNSEIDNLIKREIDCRAYFILCDSKNSRESRWVEEEENYIKSKGRIYEIIDIESDQSQIRSAVSRFERRTSAFISYSRQDTIIAHAIKSSLEANHYTTYFAVDNNFFIGSSFESIINKAITKNSNEGFVVILLSQFFVRSSYCMKELQLALGDRGTNTSSILLVSIDGTKPNDVPELYGLPIRWIDATNCDEKQVAKKIVSFFDFYNTSYRKVYNLCWELSLLDYKNENEPGDVSHFYSDTMNNTKLACRYVLGIDVPTDIDYAMRLFCEAATEGDENAAKILKVINC